MEWQHVTLKGHLSNDGSLDRNLLITSQRHCSHADQLSEFPFAGSIEQGSLKFTIHLQKLHIAMRVTVPEPGGPVPSLPSLRRGRSLHH